MKNDLKVGDVVDVFDGSRSYGIGDDGLVETFGINLKYHKHKVLAVNQVLPTDNKGFQDIAYNNTIIKNKDTGEIVFIHSDYIKNIKIKIKVYTMISPTEMMQELIKHGCVVNAEGVWLSALMPSINFRPDWWKYCGTEIDNPFNWHSWMYNVEEKEV